MLVFYDIVMGVFMKIVNLLIKIILIVKLMIIIDELL